MDHDVQCEVCGSKNPKARRSLLDSEQQRALVEKIFHCVVVSKYQLASAKTTCLLCLKKLWASRLLLQELVLVIDAITVRMHQGDRSPPADHVDTYNCRCSECVTKFGNLPILADVISQVEERDKKTEEPQPSTSREGSSSSRRTMQCKHCDKTFTHKGDLNKHLRTHTGEQPYVCEICQRKFAHTSNLARHMRLHNGEKPFKCDRCGRSFSRRDKLELHRKSKHKSST